MILTKYVDNERLVLYVNCKDLCRELVVPLSCLECHNLESSKPQELCVETDVGHASVTLLLRYRRVIGVEIAVAIQIVDVVPIWVVELFTLDLDRLSPLHLLRVKLLQQHIRHLRLPLVERLDSRFNLSDGVKLESFLIDWIYELVHTIKEDFDVFFDLLIGKEVLEIAVRVVTLFPREFLPLTTASL